MILEDYEVVPWCGRVEFRSFPRGSLMKLVVLELWVVDSNGFPVRDDCFVKVRCEDEIDALLYGSIAEYNAAENGRKFYLFFWKKINYAGDIVIDRSICAIGRSYLGEAIFLCA